MAAGIEGKWPVLGRHERALSGCGSGQIWGGRLGRSTLTLAGWLSICRSVRVMASTRWLRLALRLLRSSGS
jgi:hypothetical protein